MGLHGGVECCVSVGAEHLAESSDQTSGVEYHWPLVSAAALQSQLISTSAGVMRAPDPPDCRAEPALAW